MMTRLITRGVTPVAIAGALLGGGCAYNATGVAPPKTLILEFSVEGDRFVPSPNWAYYLVLDTNGNPDDAPLVNGPAPLQFPYPDPRSYLPFYRDERAILDRDPVAVPTSVWSTYFALYEEAGQFVVWQGRPNPSRGGRAAPERWCRRRRHRRRRDS